MDDLFDVGYIVFVILIFLFSIVKNMAKGKKPGPASARPVSPPVAPNRTSGEDYIERKLAELLGFDVTAPEKPKPRPTAQPIPQQVPASRQVPTAPKKKKPEAPEKPVVKSRLPANKVADSSFRERIIWAEILAPPRARRRGRAV